MGYRYQDESFIRLPIFLRHVWSFGDCTPTCRFASCFNAFWTALIFNADEGVAGNYAEKADTSPGRTLVSQVLGGLMVTILDIK